MLSVDQEARRAAEAAGEDAGDIEAGITQGQLIKWYLQLQTERWAVHEVSTCMFDGLVSSSEGVQMCGEEIDAGDTQSDNSWLISSRSHFGFIRYIPSQLQVFASMQWYDAHPSSVVGPCQ